MQAHPVMVTFTATSGAHNVVAGTLQTTMPDFFLRFADTPNGAPYLNFGTPYQIGTYPANPAPIFDRVYSKDYYWSLFHDSTVAQGGFGDWTATATYEITYQ
ncbi:hypothetical protein [Serratia fonticola]|uniref:hypothetical protein n=1 Tax=Serratia fonticola TaxID=47917 RepID=UPI00301C02A7